MEELSQSDKDRVLYFIQQNDLDFKSVETIISKFQLISYDNLRFFIHPYQEQYVVIKYDVKKDKPGGSAYEYYYFKNLQQVLEQLSLYDKSIPKTYWYPTTNSIDIGFDSVNHIDDWYSEFKGDSDKWSVDDYGEYKYLTYDDDTYKPQLKSPFNTLHEVSPINKEEFLEVGRLNFEIHPISCSPGEERYYFKICSNNEEVLKEYINYIIKSKKGLNMFLDTLFKEMDKFKK